MKHQLTCQNKKCTRVNREFYSYKEKQKYCGYACRDAAKRKVERPSAATLIALAKKEEFRNQGEVNMTALARHFGVDAKVVRKWVEQLDCRSRM